MLVDLDPAAVSLLVDLANSETLDIQQGIVSYGTNDDNIDTISVLAEAVAAMEKAQGF